MKLKKKSFLLLIFGCFCILKIFKNHSEKEMNKISSFMVDHTKLGIGMYISQINRDIITYDIRIKLPNGGDYLSTASLHTIEHLFATYIRNSQYAENILYVGVMGCRTGFYILLRDTITYEQAIKLVSSAFKYIENYNGEIPGCSLKECGNCFDHNLELAKKDILQIIDKLENYTVDMLNYNRMCEF